MAAAATLCLAFVAATLLLFPAYARSALPVIVDIYQPARDSWSNLVFFSAAPFNLVLLVALAIGSARGFAHPPSARRFVAPVETLICAYASAGFLASFFIQGKGWMNHAYPGLVLALLAWVFFVVDAPPGVRAARTGRLFKYVCLPILIAAPFVFGVVRVVGDAEEHVGLRAAIARVAPPRPRLIAMARQLDYSHPVTRQLGGVWVGRPNSLWTSALVNGLLNGASDPVRRARLEDYRRRDLAVFAQDVRDGRPDAIVVEDKGTREWVVKQPETAGVLDDFEQTAQAEDIEIWTRKRP